MKIRYIFFILIACLFVTYKTCPYGLENAFRLLLENSFYIPKESCICTFRGTVDADGSGEGWLYGEDDKFYYGMNTEYESEHDPSYYILKKGQESQIFNRFDYKTWDKKEGIKRMTKWEARKVAR
jgi:hypothetical protein